MNTPCFSISLFVSFSPPFNLFSTSARTRKESAMLTPLFSTLKELLSKYLLNKDPPH